MAKDRILQPFLSITRDKFTVDTIEDLKRRIDFKVGDVIELNGYYVAGDGADHKRKIESVDDGSGAQLANGLWANIVHGGEVNVCWFGAKGDGTTDDTLNIQKALDSSSSIKFRDNKKYVIDQVEIGSYKVINFNNSTITSKNFDRPCLVKKTTLDQVENVIIENAKIEVSADPTKVIDCMIEMRAFRNSTIRNISIVGAGKRYAKHIIKVGGTFTYINTIQNAFVRCDLVADSVIKAFNDGSYLKNPNLIYIDKFFVYSAHDLKCGIDIENSTVAVISDSLFEDIPFSTAVKYGSSCTVKNCWFEQGYQGLDYLSLDNNSTETNGAKLKIDDCYFSAGSVVKFKSTERGIISNCRGSAKVFGKFSTLNARQLSVNYGSEIFTIGGAKPLYQGSNNFKVLENSLNGEIKVYNRFLVKGATGQTFAMQMLQQEGYIVSNCQVSGGDMTMNPNIRINNPLFDWESKTVRFEVPNTNDMICESITTLVPKNEMEEIPYTQALEEAAEEFVILKMSEINDMDKIIFKNNLK